MKKIFLLSCLFLLTAISYAQNDEDKKFLLTSKIKSISFSALNLIDPYLSPMLYSGIGVRYGSENKRFLSTENTRLSIQNRLNMDAGLLLNPASTASMLYFGMNYGWGLQYHFQPINGFQFWAGSLWDIDFGYKEIQRNINNPVNVDLATNLNLTGNASYDLRLRRNVLKLQLVLQTPIVGCMFVPPGGASYYDMFIVGDMSNTIHFSSLHNKRGLYEYFSVDVPFKQSIWRFGVGLQNLKYSANNLVFVQNEFRLTAGITYDVATFAGRKNKAPKNFLSTNE